MPSPTTPPQICLLCSLRSAANAAIRRPKRRPIIAREFSNTTPQNLHINRIDSLRRTRGDLKTNWNEARPVRPPRDDNRKSNPDFKVRRSGNSISDLRRIVDNLLDQAFDWQNAKVLAGVIDTFKISDREYDKGFRQWRQHVHNILSPKAGTAPKDRIDLTRADETFISQLKAATNNAQSGRIDQKQMHVHLYAILKRTFSRYLIGLRFSHAETKTQQALADLRYPLEWFPDARTMGRKIIMHVGPTNSGKTYQALKRLEEAESGAYAGPLRLLAHEVYNRLNSKGIPCALVTGEERRIPDDTNFAKRACTVEMLSGSQMDVCVIDEIQMIGDASRGWAWTEAVCGVRAKELHLCGEERTVPLIRELATMMGDELEIRKYKRLSPLAVAPYSLEGDLSKLQKGDCLVSFSVVNIHALKKQIEQRTGRKVAIIYGSLPPEVRAQQARLFNDPDNDYDFLVASDAVGMGLNLSIKRVIFETVRKSDGESVKLLKISDIKQIGGRAGRYKVAPSTATKAIDDVAATEQTLPEPATAGPTPTDQTQGWVTTLEAEDHHIVKEAMGLDPEPINSAGLFPPAAIVKRFSNYFPPGTPFSFVLQRLHEFAQVNSRFHLCNLRDHVIIADAIQDVDGLAIEDRLIFCQAPVGTNNAAQLDFCHTLAESAAKQSGGGILDLPGLNLEILDEPLREKNRQQLYELEILHKQLILYLWLSFRFSGIFNTRALAMHVKELVESKIEMCLSNVKISEGSRKQARRQQRETELLEALRRQDLITDNGNGDSSTRTEDDREKERAEWSLLGQNENDIEEDVEESWEHDSRTSAPSSTQKISSDTITTTATTAGTTQVRSNQEARIEAEEPAQNRAAAIGQ